MRKVSLKDNWKTVKFQGLDVHVAVSEHYIFADAYGNVYVTSRDPSRPKANWSPSDFRKVAEIALHGLNHTTWKDTIQVID